MTPMRFGLVGCGGIASIHAACMQDLQAEGHALLVAGVETDPARRSAFGEKWGITMHGSLAELLARTDLDAVTICSPSGLHGTQAVQVAESGRHILCEKPLDTRLDRADAAIRAAEKSSVVLSGIFQQRFVPSAQKVKRAIDAGLFGTINIVHCETPWFRAQNYYDSGDWRGTWDLDGGVLSNQSPHMIDRILWLAGDVEDVISATVDPGRDRNIEAETLGVATIRLKNGALGTITGTTLAFPGLPQRVLICGSEGSASFVGDDLTFFHTKNPFPAPPYSPEPEAPPTAAPVENKASQALGMDRKSHRDNIRNFIVSIRGKRQPVVTPQDMRRVVRVLNLIYERAGAGPYAKR
jgi:UDP-N-acetyl-2-amino-2-deoxyglucuronate dehydrogenase